MTIKPMNWFIRLITFGWPDAITLAPFGIYVKYFDDKIINHEKIHWCQQLEVYCVAIFLALVTQGVLLLFNIYAWWLIVFLIFPFLFYYLWYLIEWIVRIFINGKYAYQKILFEQEAFDNEDNPNYLETRKHFAWL